MNDIRYKVKTPIETFQYIFLQTKYIPKSIITFFIKYTYIYFLLFLIMDTIFFKYKILYFYLSHILLYKIFNLCFTKNYTYILKSVHLILL